MPKYRLRRAVSGDIPPLKKLWILIFSDSLDYVDLFYEMMFDRCCIYIVEDQSAIISMVHVVDFGELITDDKPGFPCSYIYAFGTHPAFRGKGVGTELLDFALADAYSSGVRFISVKPSTDKLFDYYKNRFGFFDYFYAVQSKYLGLPPSTGEFSFIEASPLSYLNFRERALSGRTRLIQPVELIAFQQSTCVLSGGGMYLINHNGVTVGCSTVERDSGLLHLPELIISPSLAEQAVSALLLKFQTENCIAYSPSEQNKSPFAMLKTFDAEPPVPGAYLGFALN